MYSLTSDPVPSSSMPAWKQSMLKAGWEEYGPADLIRHDGTVHDRGQDEIQFEVYSEWSVCRSNATDPTRKGIRPWFIKQGLELPPENLATEVSHLRVRDGKVWEQYGADLCAPPQSFQKIYWTPKNAEAEKVWTEIVEIQFDSWQWANEKAKRGSGDIASAQTHPDLRKKLAELSDKAKNAVMRNAELVLVLFQGLSSDELKVMAEIGKRIINEESDGTELDDTLRTKIAMKHHGLWCEEEKRKLRAYEIMNLRDTCRPFDEESEVMRKDKELTRWIAIGHCRTLALLSEEVRGYIFAAAA